MHVNAKPSATHNLFVKHHATFCHRQCLLSFQAGVKTGDTLVSINGRKADLCFGCTWGLEVEVSHRHHTMKRASGLRSTSSRRGT